MNSNINLRMTYTVCGIQFWQHTNCAVFNFAVQISRFNKLGNNVLFTSMMLLFAQSFTSVILSVVACVLRCTRKVYTRHACLAGNTAPFHLWRNIYCGIRLLTL